MYIKILQINEEVHMESFNYLIILVINTLKNFYQIIIIEHLLFLILLIK